MKITKFQIYAFCSIVLSTAVITKTYMKYEQFYPTVRRLVSWNFGKISLINTFFCVLVLISKVFIWIFFSKLRRYESDKVYEKFFFDLIGFCFSLTVFRMDFSRQIIISYLMLTSLKALHIISKLRALFYESLTIQPNLLVKCVKLLIFMCLMWCVDVGAMYYYGMDFFSGNVNYNLLFFLEYTNCLIVLSAAIIRTAVFLYNSFIRSSSWENRGEFVFYLDITAILIQTVALLLFFFILLTNFGLPIHILRELFMTFNQLVKKIKELTNYRRISRNFDERFLDATVEELNQADTDCAICLQEMKVDEKPKKLICGHIFHTHCLRDWLTQNQNCPICRQLLNQPARNTPPPPQPQQRRPQQNNVQQNVQMGSGSGITPTRSSYNFQVPNFGGDISNDSYRKLFLDYFKSVQLQNVEFLKRFHELQMKEKPKESEK